MRTRLIALLLVVMAAGAEPAAARSGSAPTFRHDAARICTTFQRDLQRISTRFIEEHPGLRETSTPDQGDDTPPSDPEVRATFADYTESIARLSLAADRRLERLDVPAALHATWMRAIALDRRANGTIPLRIAGLYRQPASTSNTHRMMRLASEAAIGDARAHAVFHQLRVTDC